MKPTQLEGKTIKSINSKAINAWTITFTDGTVAEIEAEQAIATAAGNIAGLQLRDKTPVIKGPINKGWLSMVFNTLADEYGNSETLEEIVIEEEGDKIFVSYEVDGGRYGTHEGSFTVDMAARKIVSWRIPELIEGGDIDGRFKRKIEDILHIKY